MPVALLRESGAVGFAPVARPRFLIGRDLDCDLVDTSPGVADHHATVRYRRGEYLLKAEEGCSLWVGGARVPLFSLRDGDAIRFSPDAPEWHFRSRVGGTFWPPELQLGEAWLSHPAFTDPEHGPTRFGDGPPIGGRDPFRCRLVSTPSGPWIVKHLGPIGEPLEANEHLRFLAAIGGAPHPALAPLVDGGVAPHMGEPWRWMATRFVEGTSAARLVEAADTSVPQVLRILSALAGALRHLHHRGLVHRVVAPENVVVSATNPAVLIDFGHTWSAEHEFSKPSELNDVSAYTAPEAAAGDAGALAPAVDVYGWAATGFALLTGKPPQRNIRPRGVLLRIREEQPDRWRPCDEAVEPLVEVLVRCLSADPAQRPDAAACRQTLTEARARIGRPSRDATTIR